MAGVLLAVSFPPVRLLLPAFIGLVPLLLFISAQPAGPVGRWAATRAGITTGVVYFGLQLYWIAVALLPYSLLAVPAYVGMVMVLAGLTGAFAWAVHYTRERLQLPLPLVAAVFWTLLEWVQAHLGDLAFPWLGLGAALAPFPRLAGAADLVGTLGLTFWIAGVNGLIASGVLVHQERRLRSPGPAGSPGPPRHEGRSMARIVAGLLLALAVPTAYGMIRSAKLQLRPTARVAVIQPNIPEDVKLGPAGLDSSLTALTRLTLSLRGEALDLIAWPEVALPVAFLQSPELPALVHDLSDRVGAPILVGAYGVDAVEGRAGVEGGGSRRPVAYNSAFLVDARHPRDSQPWRYDKQRLVPFIERVPFIDPRLLAEPGEASRFGALGEGRHRPVLDPPTGGRLGIVICYESIFAPAAREYRTAGADYLVNITNDAWYGREEWWGRTTALWQHPAHMVLRAIETRTGVARAANTGISMFIDPIGRTHGEIPLFEPGVSVGTVYTTDVTTVFVRWGDWLGWLVVVFGCVAVVAARLAGDAGRGRGGGVPVTRGRCGNARTVR